MRAAVASGLRTLPRAADLVRGAAAALPRFPAALLRGRRGPSPRARRRLLVAALLALGLGAGYMLWFRDSSFVRVERVSVSGLSGTDAPRERAAVVAAARGMTTLHYDVGALRHALGAGAAVEDVRVSADLPHGLRIEVVEKTPVAVLDYGSEHVAVGSGGVLLPDVRPIPRSLPSIAVGALPSGQRLGAGRARRLVAAAASAPGALRSRLLRLRELPGKGLVAYLRAGPQVILGSASDLRAKWTAAAAILADGTSRGASYVDVRLPDRPVAGGLDVAPPAPDTQGAAPPGQPAAGAATSPASPTGAAPAGPATGPTTAQTAPPTRAQGTTQSPPPASPTPATGGATTGTTP